MNTRFPTKKLYDENTSPYVKSLILQNRAGIPLNEQQLKRLENEQLKETVSMVEIPKNRKQTTLPKIETNPNEVDDYNEVDLDEILREMGYGDDEDVVNGKENDVNGINNDVNDYLHWGYEDGNDVDVTELSNKELRDLIYQVLTDIEGDDLEEGITYDIEYVSYKRPDKKKYYTKRKTFNDEKHLSNWIKWISRNDAKVIGIHPLK